MCARVRRAIHYITKPTESNSMQPNTTQIEKLKLTNRTTDDIAKKIIFNNWFCHQDRSGGKKKKRNINFLKFYFHLSLFSFQPDKTQITMINDKLHLSRAGIKITQYFTSNWKIWGRKKKKKTHLWKWSGTWTRHCRSRRPSDWACTTGSQAAASPCNPKSIGPTIHRRRLLLPCGRPYIHL
jgi:hypothetical protein